jgi:hypothetical protein
MSETKFQGFDWTELYEPLLGKEYPDGGMVDEDGYAEEIREKIAAVMWTCNEEQEAELERVAGLCREFVRACAACDGYEAPMLRGLADIEHNEVFLRYVYPLLEYLWT